MINISLYGQPTSTFQYLKLMMETQAKKAGIDINIQEITDVDTLINSKISSVPTVRVNNHIEVVYKDEENLNAFVRKTMHLLLKEENYGNMNKIVVPTDFSEAAENAFQFAQNLAKDLNAAIKVVHAYYPFASDINGVTVVDKEIELIRKNQLDEFVDNVNKTWVGQIEGEPYVDGEFHLGFPAEEIQKITKNEKVDFVVVGSRGSGGSLRTIFGSVSTEIMKKARSPVFVIPPDVKYYGFRQIAYATDQLTLDSKLSNLVVDFAGKYDAVIHLVHVSGEKDAYQGYELLELMKEKYPKTKLKINILHQDSVVDSLNEYCTKENIDLLVMGVGKRNIFGQLFHKSVSKRMAINTELPLLIFHETDVNGQ